MTVLVRPVPKRTYQNGIRPFKPHIPTNNIRPITVKNWRPPVPEPLPPAPLLGPKELLALGVLVGAQIWGYLTSRPKVGAPDGWPQTWEATGKVGSTGGSVLIRITATQMQRSCTVNASTKCYGPEVIQTQASAVKTYGAGGGGVVSAGLFTKRVCGYNTAQVALAKSANPADGTIDGSFISSVGLTACGDITGYQVRLEYSNPTGTQSDPTLPQYPAEVPGWIAPQAPQPLPARQPLLPKAPPTTKPAPQPQPERSPVPVEPGPARRPIAPPALVPAPNAPPVPARVIVVRPDGTMPAPAKAPVAVTHPDAHYPIPGGGPIVGNGPQAKPEEIAKELGRLEQKLNGILNPTPDTPIEWQRLLQQVLEAIINLTDGTTYTITEKCPPCDPDQQYDPPTVKAVAPGALNAFGVITNRLDAIAELLDGQLGLKQQICPPCKPTIRGELVTVNFQSDPEEVPSRYAVKKRLSYRDLSGRGEDFHAQHWAGFSWETGGVIVISKGLSWGVPQVWAIDAAEGQRVIAHAATAAGVNLNDPRHEWVISSPKDLRYGKQATVWPVTWDQTGKLMISKRRALSGPPSWMRSP